jgi:hypothetical protein
VEDADYFGPVLAEDDCRFREIRHGNRNAIERIFWEIERWISSFANGIIHVALETAQNWFEAFAVYHNSRHINKGQFRLCVNQYDPIRLQESVDRLL